MDRTELAWAAGFWDGEGSAYLSRATGRKSGHPHARINQSSTSGPPEVLLRFQRALGFGTIRGPDLAEGREPLYRWEVSSRAEVRATYDAIHPWLGPVKRSQFDRVLDISRASAPRELRSAEQCVAWAAGLFDGEGSTYLDKHKTHAGYSRLEAAITQVDPDGTPFVLSEFLGVVGIGKIYGPYPAGPGRDPVYRWKAHRAHQIIAMIDQLRPHLGQVKREQAARAIGVIRAQLPLPRGNPAWGNRKTHCVNGHEYATARVRPYRARSVRGTEQRASKQCLVCVREGARERRRKRKNGG